MANSIRISATVIVLALSLAAPLHASAREVFECTDPVGRFDTDQPVVVVATVNDDAKTGKIDVAGVTYETDYKVKGFDRQWGFGGNDEYYEFLLIIEPNGDAMYMNFGPDSELGIPLDTQNFFCKPR